MSAGELKRAGEIAYREALPEGGEMAPTVVLVHGFPESSLMWAPLLVGLAEAGFRAIAPDLYGLGESTDSGAATYERNVAALADFIDGLGLDEVALVVHDWGGFVGLTWACQHPARVTALVISSTGFFSDGHWHGLAETMRSEQGEEVVGALDRLGFGAMLRGLSDGFDEAHIDAYWAPFERGHGRRATLEFYRSMDFEKFAPHEGKLAELAFPTLLLWGERDPFAPLSGARRFEREIPGAELVVLEGAGHFVYEDEPERTRREVVSFLRRSAG